MSLREVMVHDFIENVVQQLDSELYSNSKELLSLTDEGLGLSEVCEQIMAKLTQTENLIKAFIEKIHENPANYSFEVYRNCVNAMTTIFRANMALIHCNNGEMNLYCDESIKKISKFRLVWFYCFYSNEKRELVQFEDDPENVKVKELLNLVYNEYETVKKLCES